MSDTSLTRGLETAFGFLRSIPDLSRDQLESLSVTVHLGHILIHCETLAALTVIADALNTTIDSSVTHKGRRHHNVCGTTLNGTHVRAFWLQHLQAVKA